jgi:PAS domain-containing protein
MNLFQYGTTLFTQQQTRKQIQAEDHAKAEIIKALQENVEEGIIFVSPAKDILSINQAMERLLGYSKWETKNLRWMITWFVPRMYPIFSRLPLPIKKKSWQKICLAQT